MLSEHARAELLSQREGTGTRAAAGRGNWNWFRLTSITQKERTEAHIADRQKSQDRSYEDKSSGAAWGHDAPSWTWTRGPSRLWPQEFLARLPTTASREIEEERVREEPSTRPFCLRRRQDVAPRRAGQCPNLDDLLKPKPTIPRRRAGILHFAKFWSHQFSIVIYHMWQYFTINGPISFVDHPIDWYHFQNISKE